MRHRSFTLLETLVALSVIAMFISAGMNANRLISRSSAERTERETMKVLAMDSIRTFEAWRDWYVGSGKPVDQVSVDGALGFGTASSVSGVFYGAKPSCDPADICDSRNEYGGPLIIKWCLLGNSANTSNSAKCSSDPMNRIKVPYYSGNDSNPPFLGQGPDTGDFVGVASSPLCPNTSSPCLGMAAGVPQGKVSNVSTIIDVSNPFYDYADGTPFEGFNVGADLPYAKYKRTISIKKAVSNGAPNDFPTLTAAYIIEVTVNNRPLESTVNAKDYYHTEKALVIFTPSL